MFKKELKPPILNGKPPSISEFKTPFFRFHKLDFDNVKEQLRSFFYEIRDAKYIRGDYLNEKNEYVKPYSCLEKSIDLAFIAHKLGFEVGIVYYKFLQQEILIPELLDNYPDLKQYASPKNYGNHCFIRIKLNGKEIDLDPTWDIKLKNSFDIAEFDGKNSTILAVKPLGGFHDGSLEQAILSSNIHTPKYLKKPENKKNEILCRQIDLYLEEIRNIK